MSRGLGRSVLFASFAALLAAHPGAAGSANTAPAVLQRFLDDPTPTQFRALRRLEAHNDKFEKSAWMDVWTDGDASGFRYTIVAEEGSDYIRSKVFRATLETERKNYVFEERGAQADGLTLLTLTPKRKDVMLVDGSLYLNPHDGELVRVEGRLAKSPSFWTRHVEIVRWYRRIAGFRVPTSLESVANVRVAGVSTFRMSYEYESINGQRVGNPQPRTLARAETAQPQP